MIPRRILLLALGMSLCISLVLASTAPYGNISNYTSPEGISVITNVPITIEDVAYPQELFYLLVVFGILFIGLGIVFIADSTTIPSMSITACGVLSMGSLAIAAFMAPLVAVQYVSYQSLSLTSINNYIFSPWVGLMCWGGATAGFILTVAGVLSYLGWLSRKGVGSAQQGDYLETDGEKQDEETYRMSAQKENANRRRSEKIR